MLMWKPFLTSENSFKLSAKKVKSREMVPTQIDAAKEIGWAS